MVKLHFVDTGANIPRRLEPGVSISLVVDPSDAFITVDSTGIFAGDVLIGGNLTVEGTTTTIESTTMVIADNKITLNDGEENVAGITLGTAGLEIDRGPVLDAAFFCFDESIDSWHFDNYPLVAVADPVDATGVGDRAYNDIRYLQDVIEDLTPQLGGALDINSNDITDGTDFKWDSANARLSIGTDETTATVNGVSRGITINTQSGGGNLVNFASHRHSNNAIVSPFFFGGRTRGTSVTPAVVQNNDDVYNFVFAGWDGTDYAHAAIIAVEVDGTPGDDDMPGRIIFSTSADGSQDPTEALRLDSSQDATFAGDIILAGLVDGRNVSEDGSTLDSHVGAGGVAHAAVTTTVNGFMRATDKVIIDGLVTGVSSVFTRSGDVVSVNGDYTASQITNVAAGGIAAITVQLALNELDGDKSAVGHTHVETDITDLGSYSLTGHSHTESDISDLQSYLLNVVEDTTPQWGGNIDPNSFGILSGFDAILDFNSIGQPTIKALGTASDLDIDLIPKGAGAVVVTGNIELTGTVDGVDIAAHAGAGGAVHADATTSVSGFLSGGDKTKLDGIATSATANPSALDNVVDDASPELGGDLNVTGFGLVEDGHFILSFSTGGVNSINHIEIQHAETGLAPTIRSLGTDTDVDLNLEAQGAGLVNVSNGSSVAGAFVNDALDTLDADLAKDLGEVTFAGLAGFSAVTNANAYILVTDASGGSTRTICRSDGTNWKVVAVEGATVSA